LSTVDAFTWLRVVKGGAGLVDRLHLRRRPSHGSLTPRGIAVRVVLASPALVGRLYFPERCLGAYPEDFVVVSFGHPFLLRNFTPSLSWIE